MTKTMNFARVTTPVEVLYRSNTAEIRPMKPGRGPYLVSVKEPRKPSYLIVGEFSRLDQSKAAAEVARAALLRGARPQEAIKSAQRWVTLAF